MFDTLFKAIFTAGLIAAETIRAPHRARNRRERRQGRMADQRMGTLEIVLLILGFLGMYLLPLLYVFSSWLDFANYNLPVWAGLVGAVLFVVALWLLWRAHIDLGRSWSPTLEIGQEHNLVTGGVYRHIRHPIYAAIWLMAVAQALLLQNWIGGLANLVTFLPIYLLRVPREEAMMLETYGAAYRAYLKRTGRIVPHPGS